VICLQHSGLKSQRKGLLKNVVVDGDNIKMIWGFHGGDYEEYRLLGVVPCRSYVNLRFGGTYASIFRVGNSASEEPA
jgi:hypothetical protein